MSLRLKLVTGTTFQPVSRHEAKCWLKVEDEETAEDELIDGLIATAVRRYEEFSNRALLLQTFDAYPSPVPCAGDPIVLPRAPLVTVLSIRGFTDSDGTDTGGTAMTSSGYYIDTASEPGRVVPIGGSVYPTATRIVNPLIVRFTAGYSTASSGVPDEAKLMIKQMVAAAYEHRGDEREMVAVMDAVLEQDDSLALPEWG